MYNGIGLTTARGSGTNGYVTRNVAHVKNHKDKMDYKSEEQLKLLDQAMSKGPNADILDHERKRKVEVKCLEMEELMQEQGYSEEEIESKVGMFRQMLSEKESAAERTHEIDDESGRPVTKDSHQAAEANKEKNDKLRAAFGISEFYEDGSALNPNRKQREEEARNRAMAERQYRIVRSSEEREEQGPPEERKQKKQKSRHRSASRDDDSPSRKKSKKHKKEKTRSKSSDKKDDKEHSRRHHKSCSSEKKHKKKA